MVGISPSAVTDAIAELEAGSGVLLFERHPRGLTLTVEGHRFLAHCRTVLAAVKDAAYAFSGRASAGAGTFTLATSSTVVGYFIAPLLARFKQGFPNIETQLVEATRAGMVSGLLRGEYDLAIAVVSNFATHEQLGSQVLLRSARRLWLAPQHPLLKQGRVTLEDVAREPYIQLTIDGAEGSTARYWKAKRLQPNIVFRTESVEAVRGLIAFGHGVTILSDMMYRPWSLEGDRVAMRDVADRIPSLDMGLLWRGESVANSAAAMFQDFCRVEGFAPRDTR